MTIAQKQFDYQPYIDWIIGEHEKQKAMDCFEFAGQQFVVKPTVFNPNIATSSKLFAEEILKLDLTGKRVLDAGCGSGILSIAALKAGASFVYGFDLNKVAVETTEENLIRLSMPDNTFEVQQRDGVPDLPNFFDYIFFNPPFFDCKINATWKHSVCDLDRIFFNNVLANAKKLLRLNGRLIMIIGGELKLKSIKPLFIQQGLLDKSKNLNVTNSLELHFINCNF